MREWIIGGVVLICFLYIRRLGSILFVVPLSRILGKTVLENKSPQIARECMSSYVGYLHDERIISYVIVERISNETHPNGSS